MHTIQVATSTLQDCVPSLAHASMVHVPMLIITDVEAHTLIVKGLDGLTYSCEVAEIQGLLLRAYQTRCPDLDNLLREG